MLVGRFKVGLAFRGAQMPAGELGAIGGTKLGFKLLEQGLDAGISQINRLSGGAAAANEAQRHYTAAQSAAKSTGAGHAAAKAGRNFGQQIGFDF